MTSRKHTHVINIFFVLVAVRVEVKRVRISHIAASLVRHNSDIVTDLILLRITFERVKRIADSDIS